MKQRKLKRFLAGVCALALAVTSVPLGSQIAKAEESNKDDLRLWYTSPANISTYDSWEKWSLPMGNGGIGGSVFGGVEKERIQLNEKSLWSGGPSDSRPNYMGGNLESQGKNGERMAQIHEAFANGDNSQAKTLAGGLTGVSDDAGTNGYGYYLSYGNMYLNFEGVTAATVENYTRDLDLRTAVASIEYDKDGTHYTRENFTSYPDNVIVTHIEADGNGKINMTVNVDPDNVKGGGSNNPGAASYSRTWETTVADGLISIDGQLQDNQMKFSSHTKVIADGTVTDGTDKVSVADASEVTIITSIGTDYKNDYPEYRTGETDRQVSDRVKAYVNAAAEKKYAELKRNHVKDYGNIFGRVELNLGQEVSIKTTDALLAAYKNSTASEAERRYLEIMLFQYGRYLTIESSRETPADDPFRETLPSNLQGMWVGANNSAWHSDYHMNVNLQMNYWPTYSTNMTECAEPLIAYVDSLREPGRVTAKIYAGVESTEENPENGFMAHTQNNPFGWTCPGWSFYWGWSPAAVPWILQNCWSYYEYTGDTEFLRNNIYPMMREEAVLYDQMLVRDEDGKLVSAPAYSPETGPVTNGNTYEQTLIWQLYEDTIKAAEILDTDDAKVETWKANQAALKGPIEIGDSGQIKEWYIEKEFNKDENGNKLGEGYSHRHMSHMLGLFPGDLISVETPEWLEAANVSMQNRTDSSTGWGMGQRINTWARLGNGNKAYKLITDLFQSGILTNLWDTHPPFQIDGNFGYTSGVAEMLLQSNVGYMNLLPALPDVWAEGNVKGLKAQGDFEISMSWAEGMLAVAEILSNDGKDAVVQFPNASYATVTDKDGKVIEITVLGKDRISFATEAGMSYVVKDIPAAKKTEVPTGLTANRYTDGSVELTWDAAEGNAVYNVYRQIGDGELQLIAEDVSETVYEDQKASEELREIYYRITAKVEGLESEMSAKAAVNDMRDMAGMIDDRDSRVQYVGAWGDWNENTNYAGTIKYIEKLTGKDTATLEFIGTGIEVFSCTNKDRGQLEIIIDGESQGIVDTYSTSTVRQKKVFSKADLEYGKHTIVVRATNTISDLGSQTRWAKVEIDAFNVLDSTIIRPESIVVSTVSGIKTLGQAGSRVQMKADVLPTDAKDQSVKWSSSNNNIAAVDENGLLTVGERNGKVTITATSNADSTVTGSVTLNVVLVQEVLEPEPEIVDDGTRPTSGNVGIVNPDITWNGSWSNWAGEPEKHYGGTKTEANAGASFDYTFEGTGVEVYVQKHERFASFDIYIDDMETPIGNYSFDGSVNGDPQSLLFAKKDLTDGEHTIRCVVVERDGKTQANLDYLKIFTPIPVAGADKAALQEVIINASVLQKEVYDTEKWQVFKSAYDAAVAVMNDDEAVQATVDEAKEVLEAAVAALGAPNAPDVAGAEGRVIHTESKLIWIAWDKVPGADSYKVVWNGGEQTTTDTSLKITELQPSVAYIFNVYALNGEARSENAIEISAETTEAPGAETLLPVTNIEKKVNGDDVILTWDASEGASSYEIYVGGQKVGTTDTVTYTLENLEAGTYVVKIAARDAKGNKSLPTQFCFVLEADAAEIYKAYVDGVVVTVGEYNTRVDLHADEMKDGKNFVCWMAGADSKNLTPVSANPDYTFYLANDIWFEAVYETTPTEHEIKPEAAVINTLKLPNEAEGKIDARFVGQLTLPEGTKLLDAGLVWTTNETQELALNTGAKETHIKSINSAYQFSVTIKGMPQGRFVRGVVFARYQLPGGETGYMAENVIYSTPESRITNN